MSHATQPGLMQKLLKRFRPANEMSADGSAANTRPLPVAMREVSDGSGTTECVPAKPPLFAVRDHAVPGREYAQLLSIPKALDPDHRRAHLCAVRGLMHARQARHQAAAGAFREALSLNPRFDLAALPTFWDLPRAGCEAAVEAYRDAGLAAEATTLNARLRQSLRPRLLPTPTETRIRQAN